jgi:hypothetical protein
VGKGALERPFPFRTRAVIRGYLSWATVALKSWPRIAPFGKALLWTLT